ncbi:MAG TPA: hypothetical protein VGL56_01585 [Fimbriimonadaceae bacterium]|jgi:hypothetical protein
MSTAYRYGTNISIDLVHTLDQLTGRFQSVKDGLPELIKNSKDQYERVGLREAKYRQILVAMSSKTRSLMVLDFAGASSAHFEKWKEWSSRTANQAGTASGIEGGHGNGGKAFMVRGSDNDSFLESVNNGCRTRIGFENKNKEKRYIPGDAYEGNAIIADLKCSDPQRSLASVLGEVDMSFYKLPRECQDLFTSRLAYTAVVLREVKGWRKLPQAKFCKHSGQIIDDLLTHPQAIQSLQTCTIWIVCDGRICNSDPLKLAPLVPMKGFETLPVIPIPAELEDPQTNTLVSMADQTGNYGSLSLFATQVQMRQSEKTKGRNVITISNGRNIIASWTLLDLAPGAESGYVYGQVTAPILDASYATGADRSTLAHTDLTRALQKWCEIQVGALVAEIRAARPNDTTEGERDKAKKALDSMRDLMKQYLKPDDDSDDPGGEQEIGTGPGGGGGEITRDVFYGTKVDDNQLELGQPSISVAVGTTIRLRCQAFEHMASGRRPVRNYQREFRGGEGLVTISDEGMLSALAPVETTIYAYSPSEGVASNELIIRCLACDRLDLVAPDRPLKRGEKVEIPYEYFTVDRRRHGDVVVQAWIEPAELGKIGRKARLTAGDAPGAGKVFFNYNDNKEPESISFEISEEQVERKGTSGRHGNDIPLILMCGQEAPGLLQLPAADRTHSGGEDYPTIIEDPAFGSVIWINHASKESLKVREARSGPTGLPCSIATKTYYQFLTLKCFDVLKRLWVRQQVESQTITEREYIQNLAEAEMECASFIDVGYKLADALAQEREV